MRKNGMSILQSFIDNPSLVSPQHVSMLRELTQYGNQQQIGMLASLMQNIGLGKGVNRGEENGVSLDAMCAAMGVQITDRNKPFAFSNGIAIIPVWGALLHRDNWCDSYATGYDYIRSKFNAAMADPDVQGIAFDMNSYGGMVAGNFELCDEIHAGRSVKPSMTIVDSMMYSGGYSIGSSTGRIVATPSGGVGSIGVVMMHASVEGLLEKWGVQVSMIHAGAHKVDGNPYNNLPEDVRARFQANVDRSYEKFVALVARNRSMGAEKVRETEAMCFDADEALSLGLIDAIQTPRDALAAFRKELSGSTTFPTQGATKMSNENLQNDGGENKTTATATVTAEAPATDAVTGTPAGAAAAAPEADASAAKLSERQRVGAIMSCDEAKGRQTLANHIALNTDLSVDDAKKMLAAAPVEKAATASAFETAMANSEHPNVGADGGQNAGEQTVGQRIAANYHAASGGLNRNKEAAKT